MALNQSVFHPKFQSAVRPVLSHARKGRIVVERVLDRGKWNPATGQNDGANLQVLFQGPARVQKHGRIVKRLFVDDQNELQLIRVAIDESQNEVAFPADFVWHPNDRVTVLDGADDHMLTGLRMYVHGWVGSTNGVERVLMCQTNMKQGG